MPLIEIAGEYFDPVDVLWHDEVLTSGTAFLRHVPSDDLRDHEWEGTLGTDLGELGEVGTDLTLRLPDGSSGVFRLSQVGLGDTQAKIIGLGPAPF